MTYDNQITFTKKTFSLYKKCLHKFYINFPFTQYPIPLDNRPLIYNQIYLYGTKSNYITTTLSLHGSKFKPFSKCPFVRVFLSELKNQIYWSPFIGCSHTTSTLTVPQNDPKWSQTTVASKISGWFTTTTLNAESLNNVSSSHNL